MKSDISLARIKSDKNKVDRFMDKNPKEANLEHILELTRLIAARVRNNIPSIQQHHAMLKARGETEARLQELDQWRESRMFTEREKYAMLLSESISLKQSREVTENVLTETRRHFTIGEVISLSLAIVAINDWLDLHDDPRIRVLVVEDNPCDQELLRRQLGKAHMQENVIFVPNAREALVLLEGKRDGLFPWELIALFLDIRLPGMNGIELLQRIRTMPGMEDLPVIVMTSSNNSRDIEECHRQKVASYVQKPVTFASFSKAIANIFHQSKKTHDPLQNVIE